MCTKEGYFPISHTVCQGFKILFIFRERGRGEKERERNINQLLLAHPKLGSWPTTQARALTGNQTRDPLVYRPVLNPLSHTNQGYCVFKTLQCRLLSQRRVFQTGSHSPGELLVCHFHGQVDSSSGISQTPGSRMCRQDKTLVCGLQRMDA